jgi:hypothetical protein
VFSNALFLIVCSEDGLISVSTMDDKSRVENLKLQLERREKVRHSCRYGRGGAADKRRLR